MDIKVLYIVGKGRSGSTLLDSILGQFPGHAAVGELWHYWDADDTLERHCGCGLRRSECPRWTAIQDRLVAAGIDFEAARTALRRATSWTTVLVAAVSQRLVRRSLRDYAQYERILYEAVADEFGATVVVDSSKWPTDPVLLGMVDGVDTYAIHLIRDPRGVAHSWRRRKPQLDRDGGSDMPRHSPAQSALSWLVRNAIADLVIGRMRSDHQIRIKYEDLVESPDATLAELAALTGRPVPDDLLVSMHEIRIAENHTVAGNPDRVHSGSIQLRLDNAWQTRLGVSAYVITTLIAGPLLRRYGYALRR